MKRRDTRKIRNSIVLSAATLLAIIGLCAAWILNNARVDARRIGLMSEYPSFELGCDRQNAVTTAEDRQKIDWVMTAGSNLNNADEGDDSGIYPGAAGKLTFYVIPGQDGDLELEFDLGCSLYQETQSDETAGRLLSGHLLFFEKQEDGLYSDWIQNGTFYRTFSNAKKDEWIEVTLYWVWPYVFSQTILEKGDKHLLGRSPLFSDDVRSQIKDDMLASLEADAKVSYFYSEDPSALGAVTAQTMEQMVKNGTYASSAYTEISRLYNNADQYIGGHAGELQLQLTAAVR